MDLDTSSDKEDTGSVLISKHKMKTRFVWYNPIWVSHIKQEIQEADVIKDITETQETSHVQDQLQQQVQEKPVEYEGESEETYGEKDQKEDHEQRETEDESDDIENKEMDSTQKMEQLQELEKKGQQVERENDRKGEDHLKERETTDINEACDTVVISTQEKAV